MTILVVDDNATNLYQLRVLLEANGYDVVTATNGAEALARARQAPPDLIITDILMPVMDGFALCRAWTTDEQLESTPLVFYTATYTDSRDEEFALGLGAARFMVKPQEPQALVQAIREVIANRGKGGSAAARPATAEQRAYLKEYNEALIRKLEDKMQQLEKTNRELGQALCERQAAEETLQEGETRFRSLVETAPDGIFVQGDGRFRYLNPATLRLLGAARPDDLLGTDILARIAPEYHAVVRQRIQVQRETGATAPPMDQEYLRLDGARVSVETTAVPIRYQGRDAHLVFLRDVSGRKQAEQALRETQGLLNDVEAIAKIGGWRMDLATRRATWTLGTYAIVEIEPGQPIPGPDEHVDYYLPEYRGMVAEAMRALIEDDGPLDFEAQLRTARGNVKWCRAIGRAVRRGEKAVAVYGTLQDVTERKQAEARLNDQLAELRRWHEVTLGRESRVVELKREVNELLARGGQPPRYGSAAEEREGGHV